jgi:hypothetical protein
LECGCPLPLSLVASDGFLAPMPLGSAGLILLTLSPGIAVPGCRFQPSLALQQKLRCSRLKNRGFTPLPLELMLIRIIERGTDLVN